MEHVLHVQSPHSQIIAQTSITHVKYAWMILKITRISCKYLVIQISTKEIITWHEMWQSMRPHHCIPGSSITHHTGHVATPRTKDAVREGHTCTTFALHLAHCIYYVVHPACHHGHHITSLEHQQHLTQHSPLQDSVHAFGRVILQGSRLIVSQCHFYQIHKTCKKWKITLSSMAMYSVMRDIHDARRVPIRHIQLFKSADFRTMGHWKFITFCWYALYILKAIELRLI